MNSWEEFVTFKFPLVVKINSVLFILKMKNVQSQFAVKLQSWFKSYPFRFPP